MQAAKRKGIMKIFGDWDESFRVMPKITKYRGPHTCKPADVGSDFLAGELEGLIKAQPSLSIAELISWVKEEFGYTISVENMWDAKKKAITSILGDLDKSFSVLAQVHGYSLLI